MAYFEYLYSDQWNQDELEQHVQETYAYHNGEYVVYITSGEYHNGDAIDAFNDYVNQFLLEYCGGEVEFHDIIHQTN